MICWGMKERASHKTNQLSQANQGMKLNLFNGMDWLLGWLYWWFVVGYGLPRSHLPRANSTQPNSFRLSSLHLPCFLHWSTATSEKKRRAAQLSWLISLLVFLVYELSLLIRSLSLWASCLGAGPQPITNNKRRRMNQPNSNKKRLLA